MKMKIKTPYSSLFPLAALTAFAIVSGCASPTENTVTALHQTGVSATIDTAHVITDPKMTVFVSDIRETIAPNGIRKLSIDFTNSHNSSRVGYYKIEWFDADGMDLPSSLTFWKRFRFEGRGTITEAATAPSAKAADFKIKLSANPY